MRRSLPAALASIALLVTAAGLASTASAQTAPADPPVTPRAACGPGSLPEPSIQGRVPAAEVAAGRAAQGYRCNVELLSTEGSNGGFKVERYVDAAGNDCAYFDTSTVSPTDLGAQLQEGLGVAVLDMSDPAAPRRTTTLTTPAMLTPHESLLVNSKRGLLAAVAGNLLTAPGVLDVYDISADCREPVLASSTPLGVLGHESGFSPDGRTFWAASLGGGTLTAVDLTDPAAPAIVYVGNHDTHGVTISDDGRRAYLAAGAGFPRNELMLPARVDGLVVLDVGQVQDRVPNPTVTEVSSLTWPTVTIPQAALPMTIKGRPYLFEIDEFATNDQMQTFPNSAKVGAARIIDLSDERAPKVVSDVRLAVHQRAVRPSLADDPGASTPAAGYAGHYCGIPQRADPGIVACSFLASGLRVFDIRDPLAPKEVAYYVAPVPAGGEANAAYASPSFVPERNEIWYADRSRGFIALRLTNDAWPQGRAAGPGAAPVTADGPQAAPAPAAAPRPAAGALPATGLAVPVGIALALLVGAGALRRRAA